MYILYICSNNIIDEQTSHQQVEMTMRDVEGFVANKKTYHAEPGSPVQTDGDLRLSQSYCCWRRETSDFTDDFRVDQGSKSRATYHPWDW